jgi:hypothetical protein
MTVLAWHVDICADECEDLLARAERGRLAVVVAGQPTVVPARHVFDPVRRCVLVPVAVAPSWPWVAYEVEGDSDPHGGWRVVVAGCTEEVLDPLEVAHIAHLGGLDPRTTVGARWLRIRPTRLRGMRVGAAGR